MAYTPHTWEVNEVITPAKLNALEQGVASAGSVATVIVDCNKGGLSGLYGTERFFVGYARYTNGVCSIESPLTEYYAVAPYRARCYIPVPLTDEEDDFKPYIFWEWNVADSRSFTITGNISTTKTDANGRQDATHWESLTYSGFEVMGDGKIEVEYYD